MCSVACQMHDQIAQHYELFAAQNHAHYDMMHGLWPYVTAKLQQLLL